MSQGGLRELKKQRTRELLAGTTLRLVQEKGLERVTLDEIARVAFVSPRTVSNYFSCKEEAVIAAGRTYSDGLVRELDRRPSDEPPLTSLCSVALDFVRSLSAEELELNRQKLDLAERHPNLRPFMMARYEALEDALRPALAARTGTDVATDIYPWLLAASAVAALRLTMWHWAASGADAEELSETILSAFAQLGAGLPAPGAGRPAEGGGRGEPAA